MTHGFFTMPTALGQGRRATDEATTALKAAASLVGQA